MLVVFKVTCTDICCSASRLACPLQPIEMGLGSGNGGSTKTKQDICRRRVQNERYHKGPGLSVPVLIRDLD